MDKTIGDGNNSQLKVIEGSGKDHSSNATKSVTKGISDKGLLDMLERLQRENPAQAARRAVEYLMENSDFKINKNPDGSFSAKSVRNPDAPPEDPVEVLLFCIRARIRRSKR